MTDGFKALEGTSIPNHIVRSELLEVFKQQNHKYKTIPGFLYSAFIDVPESGQLEGDVTISGYILISSGAGLLKHFHDWGFEGDIPNV